MNMWLKIPVLSVLFFGQVSIAAGFDPELCGDVGLVSAEMVEYHLAGAYWQDQESVCLDQSKFKTILAEHITAGEGPLEPELLIPKGAKVEVLSKKSLDRGGIEVVFRVKARKGKKEILLKDSLTFLWNPEIVRKEEGCAIPEGSPKRFALREECLRGKE
jgi:hypothetical protein